jgi:hypothetical protein
MDRVAKKLDSKLREWKPELAEVVRQQVAELIDLADHDALDIARSRKVEQQILVFNCINKRL